MSRLKVSSVRFPVRCERGFSIIEIAVVLAILGLLAGALMPMTSKMMEQQKRKDTVNKMAVVEQALVNFVSANRRLPCPADGAVASGVAGVGSEQLANGWQCTAMDRGVIPWATLGLSENDAQDGWGNRFTYRPASDAAQPALTLTGPNALDATRCDPAGTAAATIYNPAVATSFVCNQPPACSSTNLGNCTSPQNFLTNRGLRVALDAPGNLVNDPSPPGLNPIFTGAAYVLISHGADGQGAYMPTGTLIVSGVAGANESWNLNNVALRVPPLAYYDASIPNDSTGGPHFDDILLHPTISSLLTKAQLGPRAQP